MCTTFTDSDVDKRVKNANGEAIGVVTAIDDDVAHVEPRSGVMDSIKAAIGWNQTGGDTIPIRDDAVDEITAETIRLERESLNWDDGAIPESETTASDDHRDTQTTSEWNETDPETADRSIDTTDDPGDSAGLETADEADGSAAVDHSQPRTDDSETASADVGEMDDGGAEPALAAEEESTLESDEEPILESDEELRDELNRGMKIEPPDEHVETESEDGAEETAGSAGETEPSESIASTDEAEIAASADREEKSVTDERVPETREDELEPPEPPTADVTDESGHGTPSTAEDRAETIDEPSGADEVETIDEPIAPETDSAEQSERESPGTASDAAADVDASEDRPPSEEMDLAAELDRGTDLEAATDGEDDEGGHEANAAEDLDRGTDLESVVAEDREATANEPPARDPAVELNEGLDLEAAVTSGQQEPTTEVSTESMDLTDTLEPGVDIEDAADTDREHASETSEDHVDSVTADRGRQSRNSQSGPFDALLAAQRSTVAGSNHLLTAGTALQRAFSTTTLSALEGQLAGQRLGGEVIQAMTRASIRAVPEAMNTGMEIDGDRDRSADVESTVGELQAAHSRLLDAMERELETGVDTPAELDAAHVDALTAGTNLLLASDGGHVELPAETGNGTDLEQHLDRTRSVYERLDEQVELGRHETTAALPAQLEQLDQHLQ